VLTVKDPLNHVTTSERENVAGCGRSQPSGNLLSTTDALGHRATYSYNCDGTLRSQTDPRGGVTTYAYDGSGRVAKMADALLNATSYTYDDSGNVLGETRTRTTFAGTTEVLKTAYEYNGDGRRTKAISPGGAFTRTVYNAVGKPSSTFDQLNRETRYTYDEQGQLTRTDSPDGTFTSTTYDVGGRRGTSTDRAGHTTSFDYDDVGRLTTTTFADLSTRTSNYDEVGRVTSSIDELGHATAYGYDNAGRRTTVTDALLHATTFAYDAAGNQLSVTDANGNAVQYEYDGLNRQVRMTYPDTTSEITDYDTQGSRSARVDQAGIRTEYGYDLLGRLTSVTNKNVDGADLVTTYGYDESGNRISQTDANGHTTAFAFDSQGRRTSRALPLGQTERFTYYNDGQLHTRTDFNGHATTYAYDAAGRPTTRTPDASFSSEQPVTWTYSATGRRASMTDATGTTSYAYDQRDRLLTKSTTEGALTYTYDIAGNRKTVRSDSGSYTVDYGYDALDRLASVTDNTVGGGTTSYHYDAGGRLSSYDYPNGTSTAIGYDTLNRAQSVKIGTAIGTPAEQLAASYAYTFFATGNRQTVAELSGRSVTWSYDNLWRLQNETIAGTAVAGAIAYQYDDVGNRLSRTSTVTGIGAQANAYDSNDRLLSDGWDHNGNTLTAGPNQYGYDSENRLLSLNASQALYVYDGDGQLVSRTTAGVTTTYLVDDQTPAGYTEIAEERVSGAVTKSYIYGPQRISMRDASGRHYYGYDAHSGVRLLMGGSGAMTDTWDYDSFGSSIGRSGTTANDFTYRGEQTDSALGLQNLRARWMDPAKGRFVTRDVWEGTDSRSTSSHRYAYVENHPADATDPTGHEELVEAVGVLQGISTLASMSLEALSVRGFAPQILMATAAALAGAAVGAIARGVANDNKPEDWNRMVFQVQGPGFNSSVPALAPQDPGVTVLEATVALEAAWLGIWADTPASGYDGVYRTYNMAIVSAAEFAVSRQIAWMSQFPPNGWYVGSGNSNHREVFATPFGEGRVDVVNGKGTNLRRFFGGAF
jgi:RHS repeat-associated protein